MSKHYFTEEQVKDALQINSFREISKAKLMEFVSLIPNMDKDVALAIIGQFPAYSDCAKVMVGELKSMCSNVLTDNSDSRGAYVAAYNGILDSLQKELNRENLSAEDRAYITEKMILVADKLAAKDTENKQFLAGLFKYGTCFMGLVLVVGGTILGVNIKGTKLSSLARS